MAKNEININVREQIKSGRSTASTLQGMREGSGQSQQMIRDLSRSPTEKGKEKGQNQQSQYLRAMMRDMQMQLKEQKKQSQIFQKGFMRLQMEMKNMVRTQRMSGGGAGDGGGAGASSNMRSSIPILGMVMGILTFAIGAMQRIGKAYESKVMEQINTAGVTGLALGQGRMTASEFGQYSKSRYMQGGTEYEDNRQQAIDPTVANYKDVFGIDAATVGQTTGQFSVVNQGSGEKVFASVITTAVEGGMRSQTQALVQGLSESMEQSIAMGFDNSKYVQNMATSLTNMYKYSRVDNVQAIQQIAKNLEGQQQSINKGQINDLMKLQLYNVGASDEFLKSEHGTEIRKKYGYDGKAVENLSILEKNRLSQIAQLEGGQTIRDMAMERIISPYIRGDSEGDFRKAVEMAGPALQSQYGQDLSAQQIEALVARVFEKKTGNKPSYVQAIEDRRAVGPDEMANFSRFTASAPFYAKSKTIERESLLLGEAGKAAFEGMDRMEKALLEIATDVAPAVATAFEGISKTMQTVIKGLSTMIDKLMKGIEVYTDTGSINEARKAAGFTLF